MNWASNNWGITDWSNATHQAVVIGTVVWFVNEMIHRSIAIKSNPTNAAAPSAVKDASDIKDIKEATEERAIADINGK